MKSRGVPAFWKLYRQLPASVRKEARQAYRHFMANPLHPSLHFHRLFNDPKFWSVRVTLDYRAVGILEGETITWIWIGSHQEFDRIFPR